MRHIIQRKYSYIPYPQWTDLPDDPKGKKGTIRSGGCGVCSCCMIIDQLTTENLSVRDCAELSFSVGGNRSSGTDMTRLGPALAEKFNLDYKEAYDVADALTALRNGGRVIALVGGIEPGNRGIFTAGGHYIVLIAAVIFMLGFMRRFDPSYEEAKKKILDNVHNGAILPARNGAYILCYPDNTETLWDIAKRYHSALRPLVMLNELPGSADPDTPQSLDGIRFLMIG